jgi:hypothetical protein
LAELSSAGRIAVDVASDTLGRLVVGTMRLDVTRGACGTAT